TVPMTSAMEIRPLTSSFVSSSVFITRSCPEQLALPKTALLQQKAVWPVWAQCCIAEEAENAD
ncbi:MAG: hypothetical protein ACK40A_02290, partial [Pannonibacter indicus]